MNALLLSTQASDDLNNLMPKRACQPAGPSGRSEALRAIRNALMEIPYATVEYATLTNDCRSMLRLRCTLFGPYLQLELAKVDVCCTLDEGAGGRMQCGIVDTDEGFKLTFIQFVSDRIYLTGRIEFVVEEPQKIKHSRARQ